MDRSDLNQQQQQIVQDLWRADAERGSVEKDAQMRSTSEQQRVALDLETGKIDAQNDLARAVNASQQLRKELSGANLTLNVIALLPKPALITGVSPGDALSEAVATTMHTLSDARDSIQELMRWRNARANFRRRLVIVGALALIVALGLSVWGLQPCAWLDSLLEHRSGCLMSFTVQGVSTTALAFSPDGYVLASAGTDNSVKLWRIATGAEIRTFNGHSGQVEAVAFSPDGRTLASASSDTTLKAWDVSTGGVKSTFRGHGGPVTSVTFSPDGRSLASGGQDGGVELSDFTSGRELRKLVAHKDVVWSLSFSPDGRTLASGSSDSTIRLWNIDTGNVVRTLVLPATVISRVSFSRDGRVLASAGYDHTIRLWDVLTGQQVNSFPGDDFALSPDSHTLGLMDAKLIKFLEISSGRVLLTIDGNGLNFSRVTFSPDGRAVATTGGNNIRLWQVK